MPSRERGEAAATVSRPSPCSSQLAAHRRRGAHLTVQNEITENGEGLRENDMGFNQGGLKLLPCTTKVKNGSGWGGDPRCCYYRNRGELCWRTWTPWRERRDAAATVS